MATVREARRALTRGDTDAALVHLWNALEPLRLRGDRRGLRDVERLAAHIVATGDGSQAREAGRLLEVVGEAGDPEETVGTAVRVGGNARPPVAFPEPEPFGDHDAEGDTELDLPERRFEPSGEPGDEQTGPRIGPLVWGLIVLAFVLFNILSGLLSD